MYQHIIDYYHHIALGLRGTDELQWCLHQIAFLKAQQAPKGRPGPALLDAILNGRA